MRVILLKLIEILFFIFFLSACKKDINSSIPAGVSVRVYNNSYINLENVWVEGVSFGRVAKNSYSVSKYIEEANKYSDVYFQIKGRKYVWMSNDYPWTPFPNGNYIFLVTPNEDVRLIWGTLIYGDHIPRTKQPEGVGYVLDSTIYHRGSSIEPAADGTIHIVGTKRTITYINPTVSLDPDSQIIYFPDAKIPKYDYNIFWVKTDERGCTINYNDYYQIPLGGAHKIKIISTSDGNFLIAGVHSVNPEYPNNLWWLKIRPDGGIISQKKYADTATKEYMRFYDLIEISGKRFLISGSKRNKGFILCLDMNGDKLWEKEFDQIVEIVSVIETSDGSFLLAGNHELLKLNPSFNPMWQKDFSRLNWVNQVIETQDEDYMIVGDESTRGYLYKISKDGTQLFAKHYAEFDILQWMTCLSDSTVLLSGHKYYEQYWLQKIDLNGTIIWDNNPGFRTPLLENRMCYPQRKYNNGVLNILNAGDGIILCEIDSFGEIVWSNKLFE